MRVLLAVLAAGAAASALGVVAAACLPDLAAIAAETAVDEASTPFVGCGDGVIATLDDGGDAGESCDPGAPDAQVSGCTSCQLACEGALDTTSGHCYFAVGSDPSYGEATRLCRQAGAHVVTFASIAEAALVRALVSDGGDMAGYWVGLSRLDALDLAYGPSRADEPGFPYPPAGGRAAGPCQGCFGLGADAGTFPREVEDAAAPEARCVAARGDAWFQVGCTAGASRPVICEREPVGTRAQARNEGFALTLASTLGTKTYLVVVASKADPDLAAQTCAGLDGGSLVIFGSAEEREQLAHEILVRDPQEQARPALEQQFWIGLAADGGGWAWDDGVPAAADSGRPLPWGHAQPAGSGGARAFIRVGASAYDTQLAHADDGARTPRYYVCQRPP